MNKLINKMWLIMAFVLAFTVVGCNDDDNDKTTTTDYAKKIEGSYNGSIVVPAMASIPAQTIEDVVITVERNDVNKATLKMNQTLPIAGQQIPLDVECPITTSDNKDGKTKIEGNVILDFETPINIMGAPVSQLPVKIAGTVDTNNNAVINITVMELITVKFTGTTAQK